MWITVKIKIILLLLFVGGGIFYGLKTWQGTALGCPEPLIQEIHKGHHHDFEGISPYHNHFSSESISSYPGPPSGIFGSSGSGFDGGYSGLSDSSASSFYSNTPGPSASSAFSGQAYLPASSDSSAFSGATYLPASNQSPTGADPTALIPDSSQLSYAYSRRKSSNGRAFSKSSDESRSFSEPEIVTPSSEVHHRQSRQISEESQSIFTDLFFRFLNVNSNQCRKRFVCELEFRNPFLGYTFRAIG